MSLSINNSPYVKVDTSPMDRPVAPAAPKGGGQTPTSSNSSMSLAPVRNDDTRAQHGELMVSSSAFTKLFDMLELVFKTMREMFAGKNITPDVMPNPEKSPKVKPDTVPEPRVNPDAGPQPRLQTDTAPPLRVMPDAGGLKPVAPTPIVPVLPAVPAPSVKVTNDANAQVNVNHCHCPDNKTDHDKGLRPRITPDFRVTPKPDGKVPPQTDVTPNVPDKEITPKVNPDLTSPGPADNRVDRDNRGFKPRMWLRT